jgi:type IV pilus assembly protein PilM
VQLAAMLQDRVAELAQREQQIQRWLRQNRLLEALPALEELAALAHPRLRPLADRAARTLEHVQAKLASLEAARNETLVQARQAAAAGDDDRAVELLESIPTAVATPPVRELLAQVRARRQEVATLTAEIRAATKAGQTSGLLSKVERLVELRPGLESAARLREKLRALEQQADQRQALKRAQAAKALAAGHDYAGAVAQLEQVPESARTPAIAGLLDQCRVRRDESASLLDYLEERLALHESDGPLAERLLKLLPNDPRAQQVAATVRRQLAGRPAAEAQPPCVWTAAPGSSQRLGLPLAPLGGFRRLAGEPLSRPEIRAHLGCFGVALGLALQGLGHAAINVNLAPREKPKRLALFSRPSAPQSAEAAWGLDLGSAALKAVLLTYDETNRRAIVAACEHIEHTRLVGPDDPDRQRILLASLETLLERTGIDPRRAWFGVNLPGQDVLYRTVRLPPVDKGKLAELVRFEAAQQIPFPLEHVIWDYQLTAGREQEDGTVSDHEALLFAVKAALVTRQLAPLAEAGIPAALVQSNHVALHNLVAFERLPPEAAANGRPPAALVTLDIGAESTDLVVSHARGLWPRSLPVGGNHFTRSLVRELQLTHEQAERLKRQPHRAPRVHQVFRLWQPIFDSLASEVQRSLGYFASQNRDVRLEQIICLGGGMSLLGMLEQLRRPQ